MFRLQGEFKSRRRALKDNLKFTKFCSNNSKVTITVIWLIIYLRHIMVLRIVSQPGTESAILYTYLSKSCSHTSVVSNIHFLRYNIVSFSFTHTTILRHTRYTISFSCSTLICYVLLYSRNLLAHNSQCSTYATKRHTLRVHRVNLRRPSESPVISTSFSPFSSCFCM